MYSRVDLEVEHYGMEKLKKRILEFLAVRQLKNKMKGVDADFVPYLTTSVHNITCMQTHTQYTHTHVCNGCMQVHTCMYTQLLMHTHNVHTHM